LVQQGYCYFSAIIEVQIHISSLISIMSAQEETKHMGDVVVSAASVATTPLLPILAVQGRYVRKRTPRLPGARGSTTGSVPASGTLIRMLVVGESTVAGVGAPDHTQALTGQIAVALSKRLERTVHWQAVGRIGATAGSAHKTLLPRVPAMPVDIIVLAFGVNEVLKGHTPNRWSHDIAHLIEDVRERVGAAPVVLAAVPPIGRFPALPQPLQGVLGIRATALARTTQRLAPTLDRVVYSAGQLDMDEGFFCADKFHPSPRGYQAWGEILAETIVPLVYAPASTNT
jgi:lysophospholipase L1-like esterase